MNKKSTRSRKRRSGSLPDIKGMIGMLKSLYSPSQLREIVDGLHLPAEEHMCSGSYGSQNNGQKE